MYKLKVTIKYVLKGNYQSHSFPQNFRLLSLLLLRLLILIIIIIYTQMFQGKIKVLLRIKKLNNPRDLVII